MPQPIKGSMASDESTETLVIESKPDMSQAPVKERAVEDADAALDRIVGKDEEAPVFADALTEKAERERDERGRFKAKEEAEAQAKAKETEDTSTEEDETEPVSTADSAIDPEEFRKALAALQRDGIPRKHLDSLTKENPQEVLEWGLKRAKVQADVDTMGREHAELRKLKDTASQVKDAEPAQPFDLD